MGLLERLHLRSEEPTESSYMWKQVKYTLIVAVPLYGVIFGVTMMDSMGYPEYLMNATTIVGLAVDGAVIAVYHASKYWSAAKYVHFSAFIRFDDNTRRKSVDLWIPPEGVEGDKENKENGNVFRYLMGPMREPILYEHPEYGPISFDRMFWDMRKKYEDEFQFRSSGEAYFDEIPVTPTQSEGVALHIYDWDEFEGEFIPFARVADSSSLMEKTLGDLHYKGTLEFNPDEKDGKELKVNKVDEKAGAKHLLRVVNFYKKRCIELEIANKRIDEQNKGILTESETLDDLIKQRQERSYKLHKRIVRPRTPLKWRILNARFLAIAILLGIAVAFLYFLFVGG